MGVPLLQQRDLSQGQGHQRRPSQQTCAWRVTQSQLQDIIQEQATPYQSCDADDEVHRRWKRQSRLELVLGLKQGWSRDSSNDGYDGAKVRLQSTRLPLSTHGDRTSCMIDHGGPMLPLLRSTGAQAGSVWRSAQTAAMLQEQHWLLTPPPAPEPTGTLHWQPGWSISL